MKTFQRLAGLVVVAGILLAPALALSKSGGANPGFAGDITRVDGSPQTCAVGGCHSSFDLNAGPGGVQVDVATPAEGSATRRITVTVDNQTPLAAGATERIQGFEATVRDPETGDLWGTLVLTDAVNTRFASSGGAYVTHTFDGNRQTSWTFDWEPGTARTGTARIYVAGNAANHDGGTTGDYIYATTADVVIAPVTEELRPELAYTVSAPRPNPVRAGGVAVLDLSLGQPGAVAVRVVDGLGRTVREVAQAERGAGSTPVTVPTAGLAPGTYFVVVEGPGGRRTQPLAVAR